MGEGGFNIAAKLKMLARYAAIQVSEGGWRYRLQKLLPGFGGTFDKEAPGILKGRIQSDLSDVTVAKFHDAFSVSHDQENILGEKPAGSGSLLMASRTRAISFGFMNRTVIGISYAIRLVSRSSSEGPETRNSKSETGNVLFEKDWAKLGASLSIALTAAPPVSAMSTDPATVD